MNGNLFSSLWQRFGSDGSGVFLDCPGREQLSYDAVAELAGRYAAVLEDMAIAPGRRVLVQVDKSPEAVALYLACLRLGIVYVPINTAYTAAEAEYFLQDCSPDLFVIDGQRRAELVAAGERAGVALVLPLIGGETSLHQRASASRVSATLTPRSPADLAVIIYTSGTTGRAKGAMLSVGNLLSNALALHQAWGWRADDVLLHALPIFHVHGLFVALHCAILSASRVLFLPRFDVTAVRRALPAATVMMGVPTFYTRLLAAAEFSAEECRSVRVFISGSAPLSPSTFAEFEIRTGHRILERYGMSEAGIIASNPLRGERLAGTVGYALPQVEVRIADQAGETAGPGQVGELEIRGPNLFAGYWQLPEKTTAEFRSDGFFRTGDLGAMAADGRITIAGRARDLIISGGYNVYPREIEGRLDDVEGIVEAAVIGVPHPDLGEAVVAVLVTANPAAFDERATLAALDTTLARFKQPKRFFVVDALPRNAMGKVEKNALRERYRSLFAGA